MRRLVCLAAVSFLAIGCSSPSTGSQVPAPTTSAPAAPSAPSAPSAASAPISPSAPSAPSAPSDTKATKPEASAAAPSGTYFWAPEVVSIPGTLVRKQLEYSNGLAVPVVVFDAPIHVQNKPGTDIAPPADASEAWLSYNGIDKAAVNKLVGKKVMYRGPLNPMQTAHHPTNPWLDGTVTAR